MYKKFIGEKREEAERDGENLQIEVALGWSQPINNDAIG